MDIGATRETLRGLVEEMTSLVTAPEDAGEDWEMTEEAAQRFDELDGQATKLRTDIEAHEKRQEAIKASTAVLHGDDRADRALPNVNRLGDPFDVSTLRLDDTADSLRARVATGLERDTVTPDWAKTAAMETLRNVRGGKRNAALLCLATGSDEYRSGFAKGMQGRYWALTDGERNALMRAQSLTDGEGGFAVPFTLDPTIIRTSASAINPIRGLARVVQTATDSWNGVTGGSATASWDAEGAEVSDDAITLTQPSIPVHKMNVFVPFSVEIEGDWADIDSDLRQAMMDGRDELEATAHIKGTGSGQPTGIEVALDGGASEIAPATPEVFAAEDVYNLQRVLPPRHRAGSPAWVMNIGTANDIRQFDTGGGGNFWTSMAPGAPETLLGWQWAEASETDDSPDINPAVTEDNFILFVGNWSRYVVVDRIGMTIELVPHLFHTTTNRPSGQRGLWGWLRTGADSVDDNAFRVLSIPTTL